MIRSLAAALVVMLSACGGGTKTPATVDNTATGGGSASNEPPGDARAIQRTATGGTLELAGNRSDSMVVAHEEMERHCGPANFTITQEGEEVVGDTEPPKTAWRVHYSCGGAAVPTPAAP